MKIGVNSRFCDSCQKCVVDFTQQSRKEILSYLLNHRNESVCGRFQRSQLDFHYTEDLIIIDRLIKEKKLSNQAIFYLLAAGVIALTSCSDTNQSSNSISVISTDSTTVQTDTIRLCAQDTTTTTEHTATPPEKVSKSSRQDVYIELTGEVMYTPDSTEEEPDIIQGKIETEPDTDAIKVYQFAEVMPEYPGGFGAFSDYMKQRLDSVRSLYPNAQGIVYLSCTVDTAGHLSSYKILRGFDGSEPFHDHIFAALDAMPAWNPGLINNKKVSVEMRLPIKFK